MLIGGLALVVLTLKWRDFLVVFFDEIHARTVGLRPDLLKALFFALLAAATVAALQTVGAFLVIAMIITPGATAYLLTDRFDRLIVDRRGDRGGVRRRSGAYLSFFLDGATGGLIIVLMTALFLAAFVFAPKHGMLAARARGGAMAELLLPFQLPFMQMAFAIAVAVALPMALLSCFLILRGWALMGDAISHAVLPGVILQLPRRPADRGRGLRRGLRLRRRHRLAARTTAGSRRTPRWAWCSRGCSGSASCSTPACRRRCTSATCCSATCSG